MEKIDKKTLQYLRDRSISLRESGKSNYETALILGITHETCSRWYKYPTKNNPNISITPYTTFYLA